MKHKAGFVNIIGNPNVGKSTLMNAWVGEKLSIITHKAQTTMTIQRGVKYSLDLASLRNINDEGLELVKLKQNDLSYEIGLGIDFYLSYFKFATEIKGTFGLLNLLKEDDSIYSNSIESLHSRGFTITFTFE